MDNDPLGLTPQQRAIEAVTTAAEALTGDVEVRVRADPDQAHIVEHGRHCPNRLPCFGRPAVGIAVPVVDVKTGKKYGEVNGVYCPLCRAMTADQPRA